MTDPTQRFSSRVEDYARFRPSYPPAILDLLAADCGLTPEAVIADVGSGTGIWSERLLQHGCRVFGIEPNRAMREAGERRLTGDPRFTSVDGTAEATTLTDHSVDLVTAAQAFHWFDRPKARAEFARILRPGGWVVLLWNDRRTDTTPFLRAYEQLLQRWGTDYRQVDHRRIDDAVLAAFFAPAPFTARVFANRQRFDLEGLAGRLRSSSYTPEPGDPRYDPMRCDLEALFRAHQHDGAVDFEYRTLVYYGQLSSASEFQPQE